MRNHDFKLGFSAIYFSLVTSLSLLAFYCVYLLSIAFFLKGLLFLIVLAYIGRLFWVEIFLMSPSSVIRLEFIEDNRWRAYTRDGREIDAKLLGDSLITAHVSILRLLSYDGTFSKTCVVFFDALPKGEYPQLVLLHLV